MKSNPFPVSGYQGPAYFCNREQEIKTISDALGAGRNVTLISPRRMGKTALIHHLFHVSAGKKNWLWVYADLMPTISLSGLAANLVTSLAQAHPESTPFGRKIWAWIKSIRPQISFDPYNGLPQISFDIARPAEQFVSLRQMFSLLEQSGKKIVLALDEFQQITQYPETQTEAWLRSEIQNLKQVSFIFAGSQQHLIGEMFNSAKRPFYASTQMLILECLERQVYHSFISQNMQKVSRTISPEDIDYLLSWCRLHTYYVQILCNRLFAGEDKNITRETINRQIEMIFREQEAIFFTFRELLTGHQWALLRAVAREQRVYEPTSGGFIGNHNLGNPATVRRSLEALLEREMILKQTDSERKGESYYQVYDVFLSRWLEQN